MTRRVTEREACIARLAPTMSNAEIAERLGISVKTVEGTLARVFRKLRVRSRAELTLEPTGPQLEPNGLLPETTTGGRLDPEAGSTREEQA
jgi:DNA-binding CsgD family transcriptional regulator